MKLFYQLSGYKLSVIQIKIFIGTVLVLITTELNYKAYDKFFVPCRYSPDIMLVDGTFCFGW